MRAAPPLGAGPFLRDSMVVRLATLSPKGAPLLTPIWFVEDRGRFNMNARRDSPAGRHVAANPEVVLLFAGEKHSRSQRVLRVRGRARLRRRLAARLLLKFALKYHFSLGGLWNLISSLQTVRVRLRYYGQRTGQSGTIEMTPVTFEFVERPRGAELNI